MCKKPFNLFSNPLLLRDPSSRVHDGFSHPIAARKRATPRAGGFTLVELLVVMSIIAVLVSIIIPIISKVRTQSMALKCEANLHSLVVGFFAFASDHDNRLPGTFVNTAVGDNAPGHGDWLIGTVGNINTAPQLGTLFPYVANDYQIYRCPMMDTMANASVLSNGRFDYSAFGVWNGCPVGSIKMTSRVYWADGHYDTMPTPVLCQEGPRSINGANEEGLYNNDDSFCDYHSKGSFYAAIDGTVNFCLPTPSGAWSWQSLGPSGQWVNIGSGGYGIVYGWFTHQ